MDFCGVFECRLDYWNSFSIKNEHIEWCLNCFTYLFERLLTFWIIKAKSKQNLIQLFGFSKSFIFNFRKSQIFLKFIEKSIQNCLIFLCVYKSRLWGNCSIKKSYDFDRSHTAKPDAFMFSSSASAKQLKTTAYQQKPNQTRRKSFTFTPIRKLSKQQFHSLSMHWAENSKKPH